MMYGSDNGYNAMEMALHLLGVVINPHYWHGIEIPEIERVVWRSDLEDEIDEMIQSIKRGK